MQLAPSTIKKFRAKIWRYYRQHKRDLPWRRTKDPYRILVSEVMLQQTQVDRIIPKYREFLQAFPTIKTLAAAPLANVLTVWQGLGYNRRAKYLKLAAEQIVKKHRGRFPQTAEELQRLPGIGPYTAAAVAAFAFNQPTVFIETNIRAVFLHEFFNPEPNVVQGESLRKIHDLELMPLIAATVSRRQAGHWYQALMDYGSYLKQQHPNPSRRSQHYTKQSTFAGSNRQLRGVIIRELTHEPQLSLPALRKLTNDDKRLPAILAQLIQEKFIVQERNTIRLAGS